MRIEAIEPLSSLASDELMFLHELLDEHPELDRHGLVVYRISRGGAVTHPLVAPSRSVVARVGPVLVSECLALGCRCELSACAATQGEHCDGHRHEDAEREDRHEDDP